MHGTGKKIDVLSVSQQFAIAAVIGLKNEAYQSAVVELIRRNTDPNAPYSTLHKALSELIDKGYLAIEEKARPAHTIGRTRVYYVATDLGKQALKTMQQTISALKRGAVHRDCE